MKHLRVLCLLVMLSAAIAALSQGTSPAPAKPATPAPQAQASPQPAQPAPTLARMLERQVNASEKQVVEACRGHAGR